MQILNISPMQTPYAERLREIIDTTDEHLRMLKRFGMNTDQWSPIVCVILLGKLDGRTRHQWESRPELPVMPKLIALFEYLELRINAIRNIEQSKVQQSIGQISLGEKQSSQLKVKGNIKGRQHPYERSQATANNNNGSQWKPKPVTPECAQCGNNVQHHLWHCETFRALGSAEKLVRLAKWGICEVCLIAKHKAAECSKGACPICKTAQHNSLVCPQNMGKRVHHVRGGKRQRRRANPE